MFRFAEPLFLYLLLLLPAVVALHYVTAAVRRRRLKRFGDKELVQALMPMHSSARLEIKFYLRCAAFALLCFTLARPQYGSRVTSDKRQGIEAIICLDVSRSMLARDVTPSRLDKAKMLISSILDKMTDDKMGLIIFAGDAFTQLPITSDYVSAKMFLDHISPDLIDVQGTDIAHAIEIATHSFTQAEGVAKAIFIITDGENHEGGAEEMAAKAAEDGFNIFVMGVGSPDGAPVPYTAGGNDYISDDKGQTVVSRMDPDMCQRIARAGKGAYIYVDNSSSAQQALANHVDHLQKSEVESTIYNERDEQFAAVAAIALMLLLLELCITDAKSPWQERLHLFKQDKASGVFSMVIILLWVGALPCVAQNDGSRRYVRQGNRCYRDSVYDKAAINYLKAIDKNDRNAVAHYNLSVAMMQRGTTADTVMSELKLAAGMEHDKWILSRIYHNMGWIRQYGKDFKGAIECYKQALRCNPYDDETRYNLVLCQRQLKDDDSQQDQQNKQDQQQDQQQQDQQQDQQQNQQQQPPQQQEQPKENEMSREAAEQLLNAAMQDERRTQDKMQQQAKQPSRRRLLKQW